MKKLTLACSAALALACDPATPAGPDTASGDVVQVREPITRDTTWTSDKTYRLEQHVFVDGAVLTIEPGTTVLGAAGSSLVIQTSARLNAEGTLEKPIVFTSAREVGQRAKGDWGGIVLLGKARINVDGGVEQIEGISGEAARTRYGGNDDSHSCGKLRYLRIEFAGFELSKDNELNGLTVGACGSGTQLDYLQIHRGADDGVEFFGGTAGIRHLIVSAPDDDGLDWDLGWTGKGQFLVVQQLSGLGNAAFESDNNGDAMESTPRSAPELWNVTLIGRAAGTASAKSIGMVLREGTAGKIRNLVMQGFGDAAIDVQDAATANQAAQGALVVQHALFWNISGSNASIPAVKNPRKDAQGLTTEPDAAHFDEQLKFLAQQPLNKMMDPQLTAATSATAPRFNPAAGSPALNPELAAAPSPGFDPARHLGAVGTVDWTSGWTSHPEN
jgi:hypothetical protein